MAAHKLDGAGTAKLKTLEEARQQLQTVHAKVELYGMEVKKNGNPGVILMQVKRLLPLLVGFLKPQFGLIADQASAVYLAAGRGGSDQVRLRALREGVATLRQSIDIAAKRVEEQHKVVDEKPEPTGG